MANKYEQYFNMGGQSNVPPSPSNIQSQLEKQQRDMALQAYKNQIQVVNQEKKERKSFIQRVGETIIDIPMSVARGVEKGKEGLEDLGLGMAGKVAGWLGNEEYERGLAEIVKLDRTAQSEQPIANLTDDSYIKGNFIGNTLQSVGQMIPAIALQALPVGGQVASMAYMGASGAGNATEEGLNEGNTLGTSLGYGLLSGGIETAIEMASGGVGGLGKGYLSKLFPNVAKSVATKIGSSTIAKVAQSMIGEGAEEVVSELVRPQLERLIKDQSEIEPATLESCLESFTVGALASGILQGGDIMVRNSTAKSLKQELTTIEQEEQKAIDDKTMTEEKANAFKDRKTSVLERAEQLGITLKDNNKNAPIDLKSANNGNIENNTQINTPNQNVNVEVNQPQIDVKTETNNKALIQDENGNYNVRDITVEQKLDNEMSLIRDNEGKYNILIKDGILLRNKSDSKAVIMNIYNQLKNEGQLEYVSKTMYDNATREGRVYQFNLLNPQNAQPSQANTSQNVASNMANNTVNNIPNQTQENVSPSKKVMISEDMKREEPTIKQKITNTINKFKIAFIDAQSGINKELKRLNYENADVVTNNARAGSNAGQSMIIDAQCDINGKRVGKSLRELFSFTNDNKQMQQDFNEYLLHYHNLERFAWDKPVFGEEVGIDVSQQRINELEKQYPDFNQHAKEVWAYNQNLLKLRLDAGLIRQDDFDKMSKTYPHYVPTYRYNKGNMAMSGISKGMAVNRSIKTAKGSDLVILPIDMQMARQTMSVLKATKINPMAKALYDSAKTNNDYTNIELKEGEPERITSIDDITYEEDINDTSISFYEEGMKKTMYVSEDIASGFKALTYNAGDPSTHLFMNMASKINRTFKALVTNYNPYFLVRNGLRDLQEAGLYTKYGKQFASNYKLAIEEIKNNGEYSIEYKSAGGRYSSIFQYDKGIATKEPTNIIAKGINKFEQLNMTIEELPRLAEYISSRKAGNSIEQALLDANDITVNFGRSGAFVKTLNNSFMPFLNAQIQGFCKLSRTIVSHKTKLQWGSLVVRATLLGIIPSVLNNLMYGDDDEYKGLRQADKDNNYLLKIGGKFVKIPKGRVFSVLSGAYNRSVETLNGSDNAWKGYGASVQQAISPVNDFRNIFSPIQDVKTNTTWYGSQLEGQNLSKLRPSQRYDESTSSIAIAIGQALNYSPKKVHYLLDQYSGIIGDILLPMTSKKANEGTLSKNFAIDPITSNKYSSDFYDLIEQETFNKNDGNMISTAKVKYLNKISSQLSDLYNKQREINNSDLSKEEKGQQVKAIQILINNAQKKALEDIKTFEIVLNNFELSTDSFEDDYREASRMTFGAEYALKNYNKSVYEKASSLSLAKIDYEMFYSAYFDTKEIDGELDDNGELIPSSKKKQVFKYIEKLALNKTQKYMLYGALGYKSSSGEEEVKKYVNSLNVSNEEKQAILKACNYD
jgi:hypothetical protein